MRTRRHPLLTQITRLLLLCALCTQGFAGGGTARGQLLSSTLKVAPALLGKVSSDLLKTVSSALKLTRVRVIVQSNGPWGPALDTLLLLNGARVLRTYQNFDMRAVELPALNLLTVALDPLVGFVSPDRETRQLGHLSLTTGADDALSLSAPGSLDGAGIGIAVLDSGLYATHKSFAGGNGASRVAMSKDFTGEGTTSDPYGHGTHVAAIAAGNGQVSKGAYLGLAPAATLLNLRVLNRSGVGTVSGLLAALDWVYQNRAAYNVRVVNLSMGTAAVDSYKNDPACRAVRKLVDAGVVVVAAAGAPESCPARTPRTPTVARSSPGLRRW